MDFSYFFQIFGNRVGVISFLLLQQVDVSALNVSRTIKFTLVFAINKDFCM
jgi:hypothetical protein